MAEDKHEQIGFHKGALTTLAKEREALLQLVGTCEQLMQMHIKGLKDLGIDLQADAQKAAQAPKKKLEEALK